jgi:purine-binding chemotaxis protein CheW
MTQAQTRDADAGGAVAAGGSGRYLTFTVGGEVYALDILEINEIIELRTLTAVPMMPACIRGVINLRGRVLPVMDLTARFGQPATVVGRRTAIIVIETGQHHDPAAGADGPGWNQGIGIMVDAVHKVMHLGEDDIEPPPAFGAGIRADFIAGMSKSDDGFVVLLDIGKVLSPVELGGAADIVSGAADPITAGPAGPDGRGPG